MSLIHKQEMTERNLAAKRANGRKSRGAVTAAGKAHSAAAKLLHGFYSQARDEAMIALGEDPKEYAGLLRSLVDDLQPRAGLQSQVVLQMGRALWRMQRAERMQDGLAVRRVHRGLQTQQLAAAPSLLHVHDIYEGLCAIGRMLNREDSTPGPGEIETLMKAFGATPPDDVRKLFPLLRSYREAAAKATGPTTEHDAAGPIPSTAEGQAREAARKQLDAALDEVIMPYARKCELLLGEFEKARSPEGIAALMAPKDENALLMQRMEESSLRQLWRLTRIFWMTKRQPGETEADESGT
jgi:hypothetical protein